VHYSFNEKALHFNLIYNSCSYSLGSYYRCKDAHQSNNVCGIESSRDSPTVTLFGKKINDQVPMEFPYQSASASSTSKVLMLAEFTLLQNEANQVNQYLLGQHWTVNQIDDIIL
jgi:hypothetical protein